MSKYPDITPREVGNFYGLRTWVEYGLKQSKNELGWADYHFTRYQDIQRWWEIICSAYLMVSLHSKQMRPSLANSQSTFASHPWWDNGKGWKNILNNLRLVIQPFILFNLISLVNSFSYSSIISAGFLNFNLLFITSQVQLLFS